VTHISLPLHTLRHTAPHSTAQYSTAPHCTTLHHTAIHCNTLQHTATHCNMDINFHGFLPNCAPFAECTLYAEIIAPPLTATNCNALQHTAPHCTTLHTAPHCTTLHHTAMHPYVQKARLSGPTISIRNLCAQICVRPKQKIHALIRDIHAQAMSILLQLLMQVYQYIFRTKSPPSQPPPPSFIFSFLLCMLNTIKSCALQDHQEEPLEL